LKRCLFVYFINNFLYLNLLEQENPRIVPSDDACDAYGEEVQHIAASREGIGQENAVYLESLVGRWVAYHAAVVSQLLDSWFVVAFVQQCYVGSGGAFLPDWAHTSQELDGGHVGDKRRVDRVASWIRRMVAVAAAAQAERRS
jgi:hypothetical protein